MVKKVENDKNTISANEINKFSYCPYQWYYERYYGRKELRLLAKQRNEDLGLTDFRQERLLEGNKRHAMVHQSYKWRMAVIKLMLIAVIAAGIYFMVRSIL